MPGFDKEKAQSNASEIEFEIQKLSSGHWDVLDRNYSSFWTHAKEISGLFKTLKPLDNQDRERLWSEFSRICDETKSKRNSEHERKKYKSGQHRDDIIRQAESARPVSLFGLDPVNAAQMQGMGADLKRAGKMLSDRKEEMFGEHKQECFKRIQDVREVHNSWWENYKQSRNKKQQEFHARVRSNIRKNQARLSKATDALYRMRAHADDLRGQISSAWSDEFKIRASGWLSEAEDKIRDIERSVRDIEEWIREDENKLD